MTPPDASATIAELTKTLGTDAAALGVRATLRPEVSQTLRAPPTLPRLDAVSASPGTQTSELELRSVLGRGGMGEVWIARQRSLDRDVAVKRLGGEAWPQRSSGRPGRRRPSSRPWGPSP